MSTSQDQINLDVAIANQGGAVYSWPHRSTGDIKWPITGSAVLRRHLTQARSITTLKRKSWRDSGKPQPTAAALPGQSIPATPNPQQSVLGGPQSFGNGGLARTLSPPSNLPRPQAPMPSNAPTASPAVTSATQPVQTAQSMPAMPQQGQAPMPQPQQMPTPAPQPQPQQQPADQQSRPT